GHRCRTHHVYRILLAETGGSMVARDRIFDRRPGTIAERLAKAMYGIVTSACANSACQFPMGYRAGRGLQEHGVRTCKLLALERLRDRRNCRIAAMRLHLAAPMLALVLAILSGGAALAQTARPANPLDILKTPMIFY